jgi:tight adherence protein C
MTLAALIALLAFALVLTTLMSLYLWAEARYRHNLIARRLYHGQERSGHQHKANLETVWQRIIIRAGLLSMPRQDETLTDLGALLTRGGYRSEKAVTFYFGIKLCLAAGLGLLYLPAMTAAGQLTARVIIFTFFPLAMGYYLPDMVLKQMVARRQQAIFRELPDALDLLLICIRAGLSFDMALHRISRELAEIAPVLSAEFGQYFLEIQSGLPRRRVLENLARRNGAPGLTAVVNVLLQSMRFGTDVAEALRVHIETMRTERRQSAEEKGAKISTQLTFPLIMLILPALLVIILGPAVISIMERLQGGL